jgi:hypothetical protein
MHDRLFGTQKTPAEFGNWTAQAQAVGLDVTAFESCLTSGRHAAEIRKDLAQGQGAGVAGTPGFFLAVTDPASTKVKTVRFINGAQPYLAFKAQIDALLTEQEAPDRENRYFARHHSQSKKYRRLMYLCRHWAKTFKRGGARPNT